MESSPRTGWTDEQAETIMGNLLRAGVLLAAAVVLVGGILYLVRYGDTHPTYHMFRGEPSDLRGIRGIVEDALSLRRRGLIQLGLLVLIATPVARVVFAIYAFARERDLLYVAVSSFVLVVLLFSLFFSRA